jgi:hypothetical protein
MAEETPKEKYERLQRDIQKEILTGYPNPTRKGCPGDAVVKQIAERRYIVTDGPWEHITHCSPCYAEFLAQKDLNRAAAAKRKIFFRYQLAAAACLIIAAAAIPAFWKRSTPEHLSNAEFDLRHSLSFRGARAQDEETTKLIPPLSLERGRVHLKIDLPETWQPGKYDVAFLDQRGEHSVFAMTGNAVMQGDSAVLSVDARIDVKPGDYMISLRRENSGWRGYPVRVIDAQR